MKLDDTRKIGLGALAVFVISQIVYLLTLTRTCPFWDSGEFISTSYILGIPHPPGTPFYVLIGRIFSMLPIGSIATRVNYLSAISTSLAAVFACLLTYEIYRWMQRGRTERLPAEFGVFAGVSAGLFTAFSRTIWENALEAEVYGLSSAVVVAAFWLVVRWAGEEGSEKRDNRLFVLAYYLVAVSAGIHMGTFLVVPALVFFVWLVDHRTFAPGKFSALIVAGILVGLQPAMLPLLKEGWLVLLGLGLIGSLLLGRVWSPMGPRGVVFWCLLLGVFGLLTHAYLFIRAAHHPMINEADPANWHRFWLALIRDQYKPVNPFLVRNASPAVQFTKHFWRYVRDQYELGFFRPAWLGLYLPYLVGLVGAVEHARKDRKTFFAMLIFYLITTIGMIFYLNFKDDEVRDRDYFFTMSFQVFAIWIGLGFMALASWARWAYSEGKDRLGHYLAWGIAILGVVLPLLTCANFYHMRDRSRFYLARDLAYNMLNPLEPNSLLFTNGDNDTFPLWYLQEVEKIRRDVRIVNLSLLNTDWYVKQLRDYSPKVDVGWNDKEIEGVRAIPEVFASYAQEEIRKDQYESYLKSFGLRKYVPDLDEFTWAKDVASRRIIEREYGKKPIYFAVTVPDQMGFTNRLTMEGIVFRLGDPHPGKEEAVDVEKTLHNLRNVYLYRGLLKKDGTYDDSVYKDDNAQRLVQNYAAGYVRAGEALIEEATPAQSSSPMAGQDAEAKREEAFRAVDQALRLTNSVSVVYSAAVMYYRAERFDLAESMFRKLIDRGYDDFAILRLLGRAVERQDRIQEAEQIYLRAYQENPDEQEALREIFSFYLEQNRLQEAADVLDRWVRRHPADDQAKKRLAELRDSMGAH